MLERRHGIRVRGLTLVSAGIAALSFWHDFFLESGWDGGVVEISTDGGATWKDLGPHMTANGYPGSVSGYYGNPLGDAKSQLYPLM